MQDNQESRERLVRLDLRVLKVSRVRQDHPHLKEPRENVVLEESQDLLVMMDHRDHQDLQVKEVNQDLLAYLALMDCLEAKVMMDQLADLVNEETLVLLANVVQGELLVEEAQQVCLDKMDKEVIQENLVQMV